jgi:hypothetical protein
MTQYEQLSLAFLAQIAEGISRLTIAVQPLDDEQRSKLHEQRVGLDKSLLGLMELLKKSVEMQSPSKT